MRDIPFNPTTSPDRRGSAAAGAAAPCAALLVGLHHGPGVFQRGQRVAARRRADIFADAVGDIFQEGVDAPREGLAEIGDAGVTPWSTQAGASRLGQPAGQ